MSTDSFATRLLVHAPPAVQRHLYQSCSQQDVGAWPDGGPTIETGIELLELAEDHEARDHLIRQFRNPDLLVHLAEHVTELGATPSRPCLHSSGTGTCRSKGFSTCNRPQR